MKLTSSLQMHWISVMFHEMGDMCDICGTNDDVHMYIVKVYNDGPTWGVALPW